LIKTERRIVCAVGKGIDVEDDKRVQGRKPRFEVQIDKAYNQFEQQRTFSREDLHRGERELILHLISKTCIVVTMYSYYFMFYFRHQKLKSPF